METKATPFDKLQVLNGSHLKLIAIITMLLDHFALIFSEILSAPLVTVMGRGISPAFILNKLGRLAFPIFCFLLVEGFIHTRSRRNYAISLAAFALISEIPFNLMKSGQLFYTGAQNIYFTLLIGFAVLYIMENCKNAVLKTVLLVAAVLLLPYLHVDYGVRGVLLIALMYLLRDKKLYRALFSYPMLSGGLYAWCSFIPISMYNGERGFIKGKALKYAFYVFYPLHIAVLLLLRRFL